MSCDYPYVSRDLDSSFSTPDFYAFHHAAILLANNKGTFFFGNSIHSQRSGWRYANGWSYGRLSRQSVPNL
jgi:hypothetical protein